MTTYRPQSVYRILVLVSAVLVILFAWDLLHGVEAGSVLFFLISVGLLLWSGRTAMTVVSVDLTTLAVSAPLSGANTIEYGQINSVSEEGRIQQSIVVTYHPRNENGMLDLDRAQSLMLPALQQQTELYKFLEQKAP